MAACILFLAHTTMTVSFRFGSYGLLFLLRLPSGCDSGDNLASAFIVIYGVL